MPTEKFRCSVTFDPHALATLGIDASQEENQSAHTINATVGRFAALVSQAAVELDAVLTRAEWNMIADVLNGCADLFDFGGVAPPPLALILAEVADGHRLDRAGDRWLLSGKEEARLTLPKARKLADERAGELLGKLRALTPLHGEAILAAARWFWRHAEPGAIDHTRDEWWTTAFRAKGAK